MNYITGGPSKYRVYCPEKKKEKITMYHKMRHIYDVKEISE